MDIHTWEGPEAPLAYCCGVKRFTISKIIGSHVEGTITVVDHIEHGIVFTDPWEANNNKSGEWVVRRKDDETAFWRNRETGRVYFTINSEIDKSIEAFISERIKIFLETKQEKIGPVEMDVNERVKALQEVRLFKVGNSFIFAAQIPDNSVGCSGSRCSNCNNDAAYCQQRCLWCGFPFIGPSGFPQFSKWKNLPPASKTKLVEDVYMRTNKGRLGYSNVKFVPLNNQELEAIEKLNSLDAEYFLSTHSISPKEIRKTLF